MESKAYIGINHSAEIVHTSSSGGTFSAIVHIWYLKYPNAYVCGCIMDSDLNAVHVFSNNENDTVSMRGSKYIASNLGNCFQKTAELLEKGHAVLFSGTPCQISGLNNFLTKNLIDCTKLVTVEVICHGVADKKFFKDYISHLEKRYNGKAISCNFRAKRKPGNIQDMQIIFDNGKAYNASSTKYDWFYSLYNNKNYILRSACYSCPFAKQERYADISLGDAWGNKENFGKSLILANSEKGLEVVSCLAAQMDIRETVDGEIDQSTLYHPAGKPDNYDKFWNIYKEHGYLAAQRFVGNNTFKGKAQNCLAYVANELGIKEIIKKFIRK